MIGMEIGVCYKYSKERQGIGTTNYSGLRYIAELPYVPLLGITSRSLSTSQTLKP